MNMATNNKMQMIFNYDISILLSNGLQPAVMSAWQPSFKFS